MPGQQHGVVGVGDDRGQHAVDVEADEQRAGERGGDRGDVVGEVGAGTGRHDSVTGVDEVGEEAVGPRLHVAAAHDLAQPRHPRPALVAVHLDGRDDGVAQRAAVVRVDEHGVGQLVGGAGELRQHEHAVAVEARRDVLLGDEVHAVAQRCHEHHVARAVEGRRARRGAATGRGSGSPDSRAGRARR